MRSNNFNKIEQIKNEIIVEYPSLKNLAYTLAEMEYKTQVDDCDLEYIKYENNINRLINIIIVTENNVNYLSDYKSACKCLLEQYNSWRKIFPYDIFEEESVYLVVKSFFEHKLDFNIPLITLEEAKEINAKKFDAKKFVLDVINDQKNKLENKEKNNKKNLEDLYKKNIEKQEKIVDFLIKKIIILEKNNNYKKDYIISCKELIKAYDLWVKMYPISIRENKPIEMVMNVFFEHKVNKNVPLISIYEANNIIKEKNKISDIKSKSNL